MVILSDNLSDNGSTCFTGRLPFLMQNQQCQNMEWKSKQMTEDHPLAFLIYSLTPPEQRDTASFMWLSEVSS